MSRILPPVLIILLLLSFGCNKDVKQYITLYLDAETDNDLPRLDNMGNPSTPDPGNIGSSPISTRTIAVYYIELVENASTLYKQGQIIYKTPETYAGGDLAIHYDSLNITTSGENFYSVNLKRVQPGTYEYIRVVVAYMSCDIPLNILDIPGGGELLNTQAVFEPFLGFRLFAHSITPGLLSKELESNKDRGYWLLETNMNAPYDSENAVYSWQIDAGNLTSVNALHDFIPIPTSQGVMTSQFPEPLTILEDEERDLYIHLGFSTNAFFEFEDLNSNGIWDFNASDIYLSEPLIDFGLRGMSPSFEFTQ